MQDWKMELIYQLLQKLQEIDSEAAQAFWDTEAPEERAERERAEIEALKRKIFGDD